MHGPSVRGGLIFDEGLAIGEDTKFVSQYLLNEESVGVLGECLYYLTKRSDSANMSNNADPISMVENKLKVIAAKLEVDDMARNLGYATHSYWEATPMLGLLQMVALCAGAPDRGRALEALGRYAGDERVRTSLSRYRIPFKIRGLPFFLCKHGLAVRMCAAMGSLVPAAFHDQLDAAWGPR